MIKEDSLLVISIPNLCVMSWFGFSGEEEIVIPNQEKFIVELRGGRDITNPKTRKNPEGPQLCDVFCTISLGKQKYQTEVVQTSMNPRWHSIFEFEIDNCLDSSIIEISCFHSGMATNTFLGELRIPLMDHRDISLELSTTHWIPLFNPRARKRDGGAGELEVKVGVIGNFVSTKNEVYVGVDDRDVEEIYAEANAIAIESNHSAQRSLRLAKQTKQMQTDTIMKLQDQGNQVKRMQNDIDSVQNNIKQSERKLRSIESVGGTIINAFSSPRNSKCKDKAIHDRKVMKQRRKEEKMNQTMKVSKWEAQRAQDRVASGKKRSDMIQSNPKKSDVEIGSQEEQFYQTIDDTEEQLDELVSVLADIKSITLDMGVELNEQNERLDALHKEVEKAGGRTNSAIKRSRAILKG